MRIFDSGPIQGLSPSNPLTVNHNLGADVVREGVYTVYSVIDGVEGGFPVISGQVPPVPGVSVSSFSATQAVISMHADCEYVGDVKFVFYK